MAFLRFYTLQPQTSLFFSKLTKALKYTDCFGAARWAEFNGSPLRAIEFGQSITKTAKFKYK